MVTKLKLTLCCRTLNFFEHRQMNWIWGTAYKLQYRTILARVWFSKNSIILPLSLYGISYTVNGTFTYKDKRHIIKYEWLRLRVNNIKSGPQKHTDITITLFFERSLYLERERKLFFISNDVTSNSSLDWFSHWIFKFVRFLRFLIK